MPKRTPVRKATSRPKKAKKKAKTKIKADPLAEYRQAISKKGVVEALRFADDNCLAHVKQHVSTGSLELDRLLNGMGVPCGRITEIYGAHHIGKTTILSQIIAQVQRKLGGIGVIADTEGAWDIKYAHALGVDPERLMYLEFDRKHMTIEHVLENLYESADWWAANSPETPVVLGWDALGGTATNEELAKGLSDNKAPGAAAKVMSEACRQVSNRLGNTNIALVVLNHTYTNIQTGPMRVGKKKETYGGEAIRYHATIRMEVFSAGRWLTKSDGTVLGRECGAKLWKNQLGHAFNEARFAMVSGSGINNVWSVYQRLSKAGIIQVSGSWAAINLDGTVYKFQGWNGLQAKCDEDPTLFPKLVEVFQGTT